jgi:hypothetical protein
LLQPAKAASNATASTKRAARIFRFSRESRSRKVYYKIKLGSYAQGRTVGDALAVTKCFD